MTVLTGIYLALGIVALLTFLSLVVLSLTWVERKFLGRIQMRIGPMRVGPYGLLQPLADALKLVVKEDILPSWAERKLYFIAPLIVFVPSFMVWVTIPFGRDLVLQNLDLGLLYIVAFSVLSVVGLVLAGWASANKYATLGGLRVAAQLVSYEIPFIMAVLSVAMLAQSLKLTDIVDGGVIATIRDGQQVTRTLPGQHAIPFALLMPLGLFIFLASGLAELGRTPFDIHHAESEVVGGPFIEYSGAHWAVFFLAEYINTFAIAALTVLLFFGGWSWPEMPNPVLSVIWFLFKTYMVVLFIFWLRGTFPRLRIDHLMAFSWQLLIPISFLNIVIVGIYVFYGWPTWALPLMSLAVLIGVFYAIYRRTATTVERETVRVYPVKRGAQPDVR